MDLFQNFFAVNSDTGFRGTLNRFYDTLNQSLQESLGVGPEVATMTMVTIALLVLGLLAVLSNILAKFLIAKVLDRVVRRTRWKWDEALHERKVFTRLSHLVPAMVIQFVGTTIFQVYPGLADFLDKAVNLYVLVVILMVLSAVLNTVRDVLNESSVGTDVPIKGFFQAIKLVLFIVGSIMVLSVAFGQSPLVFLSGLGALTAVLLLVFRDALLGLVAGIMISVNQMVRIGDWISMPANGADGPVIDVSLTTVKVRNWDQTFTTVPSYDLISKSFKNYRGMFEKGGRRIKRAMYIDTQSIQFVSPEMLERFKRIGLLRGYLEEKLQEVQKGNDDPSLDMEVLCNGRRLTNIGTFRAYCSAYIDNSPLFRHDMISLVRQLDPTEHGLPLEIYVFTKDTGWVLHEAAQSDLFDHLLSVIGEFGLRIFQEPSGRDFRNFLRETSSSGPAA
ncbi:MAG: mechanosensitive ion channel [Opitutales bacterium]|nr:mechanosensitive ion channel [Opitutales bacterium]MCH8540433.1 mechanosensitive ion channel family protein [Opitutales bacterium]